MKDITKGFFVGLILGFMMSCNDNILADGDDSGSFGELGSSQYNPLYVKIVD